MKLRIFIAGCAPGDRAHFESMVRGLFRARPDDESWNVSLVRLSDEWSITLDGPEPHFKGLTFSASDQNLQRAIRSALQGAGGPSGPATHVPPASSSPPRPSSAASPSFARATDSRPSPASADALRRAAPTPRPQPSASARAARLSSASPAPPARSESAASAPSAAAPLPPLAPGEKRDRHECEKCGRPFAVVYVVQPNEPRENAPVACPHCWCIKNVPIAEAAAYTNDYRAEAL